MGAVFQKFATQADPQILEQIRAIAAREGKQLQSVVDEALRDLVDKKNRGDARPNVLTAFGESLAEFDGLYRELAK